MSPLTFFFITDKWNKKGIVTQNDLAGKERKASFKKIKQKKTKQKKAKQKTNKNQKRAIIIKQKSKNKQENNNKKIK